MKKSSRLTTLDWHDRYSLDISSLSTFKAALNKWMFWSVVCWRVVTVALAQDLRLSLLLPPTSSQQFNELSAMDSVLLTTEASTISFESMTRRLALSSRNGLPTSSVVGTSESTWLAQAFCPAGVCSWCWRTNSPEGLTVLKTCQHPRQFQPCHHPTSVFAGILC